MPVSYWSIRRLATGDWEVVPPSGVAIKRGCFPVRGHRGFTQDDALVIAKFGRHLSEHHPDPMSVCAICKEQGVGMYWWTGEPWLPAPGEEDEDDPDFTSDPEDPSDPSWTP